MKNTKSTFVSDLIKEPCFWGILASIFVFFAISKYLSILIAIIILIRWNIKNSKIKRKEFIATQANSFVDKIKKDGKLPIIQTNALLDANEQAFLSENTKLQETRSVRQTVGGFGGVRLAKGVVVGRSSSRSESHQEWRDIDNGQLIITNKRIMYLGAKENRSILLDKIMTIETYLNAIEITSETRTKSLQFPVTNPYIWSTVIQILRSTKGENRIPDLNITFQ